MPGGSLLVAGRSISILGEVFQAWFVPWTAVCSHAFGVQGDDILRSLFVVAGVMGTTGDIERGGAVGVAASMVGVIGVLDWFLAGIIVHVAMHLH